MLQPQIRAAPTGVKTYRNYQICLLPYKGSMEVATAAGLLASNFTIALKEFSASSTSVVVKGPVIELFEKIISKGEAVVLILNALRSLMVGKISVIIVMISPVKLK